jgi:SAM-dependent methyltransferase
MQAALRRSYWDGFARAYERLGAPLRPSSEDVHFFESTAHEWSMARGNDSVRALLLGVTPDVARMGWPAGTSLLAVDNSFAMAQFVWPGNVLGQRDVICADWLSLPCRDDSHDLVIGDGSINCLSYPIGFANFIDNLSRTIRPGGLLMLRVYLQTEPPEDPTDVLAEALTGSAGSFHAFKLRLLMALQRGVRHGIPVVEAYHWWTQRNVARKSLPHRKGWEDRDIETIEFYRDSDTVYSFPTLAELRSQLQGKFEEASIFSPAGEMGHRCRVLVLTPSCDTTPEV